ncbi:MAG: electron transport complex subunit RsxC [Mariprofundaceae bacterium]|nr:electron transport complex subunit RsxC [Mariprofundaceae bacterium]
MLRTLLSSIAERPGIFSGGIEPEMSKITAGTPIATSQIAPIYIVPIKQHIGEVCTPIVSIGEHVLRGQKIARSQGYISVPVHAPTSGKVVKIEEHAIPHPSGMGLPSIFIEPDGSDTHDESLRPIRDYRERDPAELRERVRVCGIAGLGGAVFPTFIKLLKDQSNPIKTIILNGIECEPYLTNDHRLMLEKPEAIATGLDIIMHMVGAKKAIVAIEDNKADAADAMRRAIASLPDMAHVEVRLLPTRYPMGSEKQLIQVLTGKEVPAGKLPMHIGVLCHNVGTAVAIFDAAIQGRPLTERVITVSGDAVPEPGNMRARLGTPMRFIFAQHGLEHFSDIHLLHGGPMMGERMRNPDIPVIKSTNGLLAMLNETMMKAHKVEEPCIRCGHCGVACPVSLVPNLLADQCRNDQFEKAESYNLFDCIECGACSYVCPSHIPLVHYFRYGKGQLAQISRAKNFANESKQRSEAREARIERENAERAARRKKVRSEHMPKPADEKGASAADVKGDES